LGHHFRIAMLAAGRNFRAARRRVPGKFRPFDVGFGRHHLSRRWVGIMSISPFCAPLVIAALNEHLRITSALTLLMRRINGGANRLSLRIVGPVMLVIELYFPFALMLYNVINCACHLFNPFCAW